MYVSAATILSLLLVCHDEGLLSVQQQHPIESSSKLFISAFQTTITTTPNNVPSISLHRCPSNCKSSSSGGGVITLWHRNIRSFTSSLASSPFDEEKFNEKTERELQRQRLQKAITPRWDNEKGFAKYPAYGRRDGIYQQTNIYGNDYSRLGNDDDNGMDRWNGNYNRYRRDYYVNDEYYDDRNRPFYDSYPSYSESLFGSATYPISSSSQYRDDDIDRPLRHSSPYAPTPYESPSLPISSYANSNRQSSPYPSSTSIGMSSRQTDSTFPMSGSSYGSNRYNRNDQRYERRRDNRRDPYLDPEDNRTYLHNLLDFVVDLFDERQSPRDYQGRNDRDPFSSSFPSAYDRSGSLPTSASSTSSPTFSDNSNNSPREDGSTGRFDMSGNVYDDDSTASRLYENGTGRPVRGSRMGSNSDSTRVNGSTSRFDQSRDMNGGDNRYSSNNDTTGRGGGFMGSSSGYDSSIGNSGYNSRRPDGSTGRFGISGNSRYNSDDDSQRYGSTSGLNGRSGNSRGSSSRYNNNVMYRGSRIPKTKKKNWWNLF